MFFDEAMIPIAVVGSIVMIPIVGMLTRHQQKMAEIMHGRSREEALRAELNVLRAQVGALQGQVDVQSGAIRTLASGVQPGIGSDTDKLTQRLG